MMNPRAVARVLRPLSEPLPLALQQRGQKILEPQASHPEFRTAGPIRAFLPRFRLDPFVWMAN
jgi:hypothetical protein